MPGVSIPPESEPLESAFRLKRWSAFRPVGIQAASLEAVVCTTGPSCQPANSVKALMAIVICKYCEIISILSAECSFLTLPAVKYFGVEYQTEVCQFHSVLCLMFTVTNLEQISKIITES